MAHRILIVEDDPFVAIMIEGYLAILGRETAGSAENVKGALEKLAALEIDAAILDVHLADGATSEAVAAALRAAQIPFLITTGGLDHRNADAFYGAPFLAKPFTLDDLARALADLV
ncbi:response regulator [Sphingopyxis fribergensis]